MHFQVHLRTPKFDQITDSDFLEYLSDPSYNVYCSPGLSPADGFEHPASTLPTRFPAALDIGHDLPAA